MFDCIEHTQKGVTNGYGTIVVDGKTRLLHRVIFERTNGYLPPVVRHTCNNSRCVNPAHLIGGTQKENVQDSVAAGTHIRPTKRVLTSAQVLLARSQRAAGKTIYALAKELHVTKKTVRMFLEGRTYSEIV